MPSLVGLAENQAEALEKLALIVEHSNCSMMLEISFFLQSLVWALASPCTLRLDIEPAGRRGAGRSHRADRVPGPYRCLY